MWILDKIIEKYLTQKQPNFDQSDIWDSVEAFRKITTEYGINNSQLDRLFAVNMVSRKEMNQLLCKSTQGFCQDHTDVKGRKVYTLVIADNVDYDDFEYILFHELGHILWGGDHDEDPTSLMAAYIPETKLYSAEKYLRNYCRRLRMSA
jgi:hypothetical protein